MRGKTKCLQNTQEISTLLLNNRQCSALSILCLKPSQPVLDIKFEIKAHVQNSESRDECVRVKIKKGEIVESKIRIY